MLQHEVSPKTTSVWASWIRALVQDMNESDLEMRCEWNPLALFLDTTLEIRYRSQKSIGSMPSSHTPS